MVHSKIMFCYLNKSEKDQWLPKLFDLLYENMRSIAPSGLGYDQERDAWLSEVSPALEKAPRQIVLCFVTGELAGFMQYYIREQMLMVEELQLKKKFQRTTLFYRFCKYLLSVIPGNLQTVEAYAHKRNGNSIGLMKRLGMVPFEEEGTPFVHMGGPASGIYSLFERRMT